ncbi:HNH endonuclease signature motif containing protein [Arthrobacter sp. M-10]|uniref:HNH endonuclease signature motif containing protein n=1 Tax=Arthrobacter sp. M-10 TaxID=3233037 RepID=UPI003F9162C8
MTSNAPAQLTPAEIAWLKGLKMSRRAGVVRDHILQHGAVTTGELKDIYGYSHAPRAARDLKEAGAGVSMTMVVSNGERMAQYSFTGAADKNAAGRVIIPKKFADDLKDAAGNKCAICSGVFANRELQADHRVPFEIGGDKPTMVNTDFMPLCASDNRAKSWSCETCPNWTIKHIETCEACFWAHPEGYTHVALRPERRMTIVFQGSEVVTYDQLKATASASGQAVETLVKANLVKE